MLGRPRRRRVAVKKHWVRRRRVDYGRCRCRSSRCPAGLGLGLTGRCSCRRRRSSKPSSERGRLAAAVGNVIGEPGRQLAYTRPSSRQRLLLLLDRRCRQWRCCCLSEWGRGHWGHGSALEWGIPGGSWGTKGARSHWGGVRSQWGWFVRPCCWRRLLR